MNSGELQKKIMIGLWCEPELLAQIDAARGFKGRSQFCREALRDALVAMGYSVPEKTIMPRDTVGRPKKRRDEWVLNDQKKTYGEAAPPPQNCPVSDAEKPPQPAALKPSKNQRPKTP